MTASDPHPAPFTTSPSAGVVLRGESEGSGRPLVLLHGLTATRRYVLHGSRLLARGGYLTLGYDARGHGESDPAPRPDGYVYTELTADLEHVLEAVLGEPAVLVGSSMGAHTAVALALGRAELVSGLVLITPAYDGTAAGDLEHWDRLAEAAERGDLEGFVELTGAGRLPERLREPARVATRQRMERHRDLHAVADALRSVPRSTPFDGLGRLAEVRVPALVVGSRDESDPGHPLVVAQAWADGLPRGELAVEEPGESPLAWQGARLSRAIAAFLG